MTDSPTTQRCSIVNHAAPLLGTAPLAKAWVLLEDNGPWGVKAPRSARFDAAPDLAAAAAATETSVLLVRQPGVRHEAVRRVWVAHVESGKLAAGVVNDPSELLEFDFTAIADGQLPAALKPDAATMWLVCTNSSRDACCALFGRPLVNDLVGLAASAGVTLLESSHLGGHRFAPTALGLPAGYVYGRLTVAAAASAFNSLAANHVDVSSLRGRTSLNSWQQVAEATARATIGYGGLSGLAVSECEAAREVGVTRVVEVLVPEGTRVVVTMRAFELAEHPESCGKTPVRGAGIEVIDVSVGAPT